MGRGNVPISTPFPSPSQLSHLQLIALNIHASHKMDHNRLNPYDTASGQHRQTLQAALEMEEALYIQRQQELQRDIQIQRLILQDRLDHQALMQGAGASGSGLNAASLYELQFGGSALAAQFREEQFIMHHQDQLRRHQQVQQHLQQIQPSMAISNALGGPEMTAEAIIADSLAANAIRRTPSNSIQRKRSFDQREETPKADNAVKKEQDKITRKNKTPKTPKTGTGKQPAITDGGGTAIKDPTQIKKKRGRPKGKKPMPTIKGHKILAGGVAKKIKTENAASSFTTNDLYGEIELAKEALAALAGDGPPQGLESNTPDPEPEPNPEPDYEPDLDPAPEAENYFTKGTVNDIVAAAEAEDKAVDAARCIVNFKETAVWYDTEPEEDELEEDEYIELPGFKSTLPRLPKEPEFRELDMLSDRPLPTTEVVEQTPLSTKENSTIASVKSSLGMTVEYPYPVDTWWPAVSIIRKERRIHAEKSDEEDFVEEPTLTSEDSPFRLDATAIRQRLADKIEPGVLEKLPHCRIHRMAMRSMKVATAPDHAFCWQVTENYCNEPMVCCSVCSSWRHAACGGHYKPLTIRDTTQEAFVALCDRCHAEKPFLEEFPKAKMLLEKERIELLRRGLATSAVIRQSAFSKHAGQYKWPLGSVSPAHIVGHTRRVNSRHDKAEKHWSDMVTRLGRGYGYRPKERVKVRSRELERLLVSIEDAEGATDRHNMIVFLQNDTNLEFPVGYEQRRRNLFDPADDDILSEERDSSDGLVEAVGSDEGSTGRRYYSQKSVLERLPEHANPTQSLQQCVRAGCMMHPRFDSMFCSDACGVAALEVDLLGSLRYADTIHPALLRN